PKVAARFARMRQLLTGLIADSARELDLELEIPAEQLAVAIDALADGIARQKLADPDAVPDELMGRVLSLLLTAASRAAHTGTRAPARPPRGPVGLQGNLQRHRAACARNLCQQRRRIGHVLEHVREDAEVV